MNKKLMKKAESGDVDAQMRVANEIIWERNGPIPPAMAERAVRYYKNAAKHGNQDAMIYLGTMYRWAIGVERDMDECFAWTKQATARLYPKAYQYLGYHQEIPVGYADINDDTADYKTVFDCFFKGAMLGDADCMYKVGDMYFTGKFVEKDQGFAFYLYARSAEPSEFPSASLSLRLGECYYLGLGTEQDIDLAQELLEYAIEEYEFRLGNEEKSELLMKGYNRAKHLLSSIDEDKIRSRPMCVENHEMQDEHTALTTSEPCLCTSAHIACGELGVFFAKGEIVEQDHEQAYKHFAKSALTRDLARHGSLANLATMYRKGHCIEVDERFADYCAEVSMKLEEAWRAEYEKE